MTSAPPSYIRVATRLAVGTSSNPLQFGGEVRYWIKITTSALTDRAPASYPAWKCQMSGVSTPPMKPIVPVFDVSAAAAPARYDGSESIEVRNATFEGPGPTSPTGDCPTENFVFGCSCAKCATSYP